MRVLTSWNACEFDEQKDTPSWSDRPSTAKERMVKMSYFVFAIACLGVFSGIAGPATAAQQAQTTAPTSIRTSRYDKAAEVVTSGTIISISAQSDSTTVLRGTYLGLQAGPLTLNVHMGLYSASAIPFKAGDQVKVTGSLVTVNGKQVLLARQVQSANQALTVRGPNGFVLHAPSTNRTQGEQQ